MLTQPRADLFDRIMSKIQREEKLMIIKRRLILQSSGLVMSVLLFIPFAIKLYSDLAVSGLMQYLSLLFSDLNIVMANLGDYGLTLLESTPVLSLTLVSAALLAFVFYVAKLEDSYSDFRKLITN